VVWNDSVSKNDTRSFATSGFCFCSFVLPQKNQKVKAANKKALRPSSRLSAAE
jgi:hypothetical protein